MGGKEGERERGRVHGREAEMIRMVACYIV